ncbi:MAG: CotH kinase family protein [Ruminococcus sp.]|nr:CotH kinase family protein [Ruminococcus sp.]
MYSRKSISKTFLTFAAAAACFSSQLIAPSALAAETAAGSVAEIIDQESFRMTIPTVYLHLDGGTEEFDKVNASPDHSYEATGSLDIVIPNDFKGYAGSDTKITGLSGAKMEYFRGRGNSTWDLSGGKKPYKIKLDKKADIFGLGKSKHWALLANAMDSTLSRNRYSAYLSEGMGFDFTPSGYPVDVMLDDGSGGYTYLGSYYLCENVRIESGRMDLDLPEENETSEGEYLLAHQQGFVGKNLFATDRNVDLMNDEPGFDPADGETGTEAQKEYIRSYVQEAEDAIVLGRVKDDNAPDGWREVDTEDYIDYETTAKYWLIEDFSMNRDAFKGGSAYFYKTADTDTEKGKLYFGPVWDMDLAYRTAVQDGFYVKHLWTNSLLTDSKFVDTVISEWNRKGGIRDRAIELSKDGGLLDQYAEELKTSAEQDTAVHPGIYTELPPFEEAVRLDKEWLKARIKWYDENLAKELPDLIRTVTLKYGDGKYDFDRYCLHKGDTLIKSDLPVIEKEGYVFLHWEDEDGNEYAFEDPIEENITLTARYIAEEDAVKAREIYFYKPHAVVQLDEGSYTPRYEILPGRADDKRIEWSSSDENVAVINKEGDANLAGIGKTTVTARLSNGNEFSYELEVVKTPNVPKRLHLESDSLELKVGERRQMDYWVSPSGAEYSYADYSVEVLEGDAPIYVDEYGAITALSPGKARVTLKVTAFDTSADQVTPIELTSSFDVIVTGDTQQVKIAAVWNDGDNKDGIRPDKATVSVFKGGDFYKLMPVTEEEGWTLSFDCNSDINDYTIGVFADDVISGIDGEGSYSFEISGSAAEGFTVTFTHTPLKQDESGEESSLDERSEEESSENESSDSESSEEESSSAADSSKPADRSNDVNPKTGAAVSLLTAAAAVTAVFVIRHREYLDQ